MTVERDASRYGWVIVAAMLAVQTVSSGLGFYNMSVYMNQFTRELAVPLADVSFAVSLFFIAGGVTGIYVAKIFDRIHVRWIMIVGASVAGMSLGLVGHADSIGQLYLLFILFGIGNTGVSIVVATTLITRWFPGRNRSIALSIASTGLSLGGVLVTPLSAYLLNRYGLMSTMPGLGLMFVVLICPIALWMVRLPPPLDQVAQGSVAPLEWAYADAIRTRFFICLSIGYVLVMAAQVGGIAHLYNRVEGLIDYAIAANAVQILTLASIVGRISGGWLVSRISIRSFTLCNLVVQSLGLLTIGYAQTSQMALLGAGLFGVSVGNLLMLQPLWLAEVFPGRVYPRVFALANALSVVGVALGPFVMGLAYDAANYTLSFLLAVAASIIGFCFIATAGRTAAGPEEPQPT